MASAPEIDRPDMPPAPGGRFSRGGFALALLLAPVIGLALAWAAQVVQSYFAPLILFPVLLGIFAGMAVVGLARVAQIGNRSTIILAAVLAAVVAAALEHYFAYLSAYYWQRPSMDASLAVGQDASALIWKTAPGFGEYLQLQAVRGRPLLFGFVAQGWLAWLSWAIDSLLVVAAAVAVIVPALRVPYCDRCGSWYRTTRSGRIDVLTAQRLAALVGVEEINHPRSHRYRLSNCLSGCGPTRLELSWEEADGAVDLARLWLDPATRNQLAAILDGLAVENQDAENEDA
jgi:hypothetical protein